ncbi:MAG: zinc-binding dehydrogenase [Burkholderiales bacterium]
MKSFWIDGDTMGLVPREVPEPELKPGTVLTRMRAVALNRGEFVKGHGLHKPGSVKTAGYEGAGEIIAVAADVTHLRVGDRVMGRADASFAEVARMNASETLKIPVSMTWEAAAGSGITYITAYDGMFTEGNVQAGDWVLVTGASSGVGVACVQIAKAIGAHSFGVTSSAAKLDKLKSIGMDTGAATRAPNFANQVLAATGGDGAKIGINNSGGDALAESLRSLRYKGVQVIVGYVDGNVVPVFDLLAVHVNRLRVVGVSFKKRSLAERFETTRGFETTVLPLMASGAVKPLVDRVFKFDELPAAREYMESDQHLGKIVAVL